MSATVDLAAELVGRRSVTPADGGCQDLIARRLEAIGFAHQQFDHGEVKNLWCRHGEREPLFVFLGHTDVVPPGPLEHWHSDPFTPSFRDGRLYGRGAADMKGGIAAFLVACEEFLAARPEPTGSIGVLLTSDEEGPAVDGIVKAIADLSARGEHIHWCLVGEPSSDRAAGDKVRVGRRGSLSGELTVHGVQGHIAYPDKTSNPIHGFARGLTALCDQVWDNGNVHFPPTSFQVSNVRAGTGAGNVVPGDLEALFNFRYCTEVDAGQLRERVARILTEQGLDFEIAWQDPPGYPFLTAHGKLLDAVRDAIRHETGLETELSTAGGTSDGRFVAPTGAEIIELGPVNATIHQLNECVGLDELETLTRIYKRILTTLL